MASRYQEFEVWKEARSLVKAVYLHTKVFPGEERYALTGQLHRAVISVPSNIAEGSGRRSDVDFGHYLVMARGSLCEVETQLILAEDLGYAAYSPALMGMVDSLLKKLNAFISTLKKSQNDTSRKAASR